MSNTEGTSKTNKSENAGKSNDTGKTSNTGKADSPKKSVGGSQNISAQININVEGGMGGETETSAPQVGGGTAPVDVAVNLETSPEKIKNIAKQSLDIDFLASKLASRLQSTFANSLRKGG